MTLQICAENVVGDSHMPKIECIHMTYIPYKHGRDKRDCCNYHHYIVPLYNTHYPTSVTHLTGSRIL